MKRDHATKVGTGSEGAEMIFETALCAVARGARGVRMHPSATEGVRAQFFPKIRVALEKVDWPVDWDREKAYLRAYAEEMGRRGARLAAEDRRTFITRHDIETAAVTMTGYMPIAGRWCPR